MMSRHLHRKEAQLEAKQSLQRHIDILRSIKMHAIDDNAAKNEFLYLMAIPMIYAAWEGFFKLTCSICLRRYCLRGKKYKSYPDKYSALWLQKESFVNSFFDKLLSSMSLGKKQRKLSSGRFTSLSSFSGSMRDWFEKPINHLENFDELVMTYSNVNKEVTQFNAEIIGLNIEQVDLAKLDELLGRRNNIAHGGLIDYPRENTITELLAYTEKLLTEFHKSAEDWLSKN